MLSLKVEAERGSINTEGKMEGGGVCIGCRVRVKMTNDKSSIKTTLGLGEASHLCAHMTSLRATRLG